MAAVSEKVKQTEFHCSHNKKLEKGNEILYIKCAKVFASSDELREHIVERHGKPRTVGTQTIERENSGLPYCTRCENYNMVATVYSKGRKVYLCRSCDDEEIRLEQRKVKELHDLITGKYQRHEQ